MAVDRRGRLKWDDWVQNWLPVIQVPTPSTLMATAGPRLRLSEYPSRAEVELVNHLHLATKAEEGGWTLEDYFLTWAIAFLVGSDLAIDRSVWMPSSSPDLEIRAFAVVAAADFVAGRRLVRLGAVWDRRSDSIL